MPVKPRVSYQRVKTHRSYTVDEVARLLDVHKNTVREWVKAGLPTNDDQRPMLILGRELAAFLQSRRARKKVICGVGQMYCLRCRTPKSPALNMADYLPDTELSGNLVGLCPACNCVMNRRISAPQLAEIRSKMDISFPQAREQVSKTRQPSLNRDLKGSGTP
jgi:hypothetical protein